MFLEGRGQMGLDDDVVEVGPGTVVRFQHGVHFVSHTAPMRKESGLAIGDAIAVRLTVAG